MAARTTIENAGDAANPPPAGLAALAVEAERTLTPPLPDATDLDVAEADGKPPAPPPMSNEQCLMLAAGIVRGTLTTMARLTSPAATMSDDRMAPCAAALGAVLDKHGISLQGMAGGYALELAAVGVVAPVAWAIYGGIQAEIKEREAAKPKPAALPAGAVAGGPLPDAPAAGVDLTAPAKFAANDPRSVSLNA